MRRLSPLLPVLLLLAACRPEGSNAPFTDSRIPPALPTAYWPPPAWGWGLVQAGDAPPVRYGVAAPSVAPRGDLLIVAGHGESAEAWFETARDLSARGYAVWVMDGLAQGGSGRFAGARDIAYAPDMGREAEAVAAMLKVVGRPAVVVAQSTAAPSVLAALSRGAAAKAVILSAPVFDPSEAPVRAGPAAKAGLLLAKAGLGWVRATGQQPWRAVERLPPGRAGIIPAWQQANPDLRMGGVSFGWAEAFARQSRALDAPALGRVAAPVLMLLAQRQSPERARRACSALPRCTLSVLKDGRGPLHLEGDAVYERWYAALDAALAAAFPNMRPLERRDGPYSLGATEERPPLATPLQSR